MSESSQGGRPRRIRIRQLGLFLGPAAALLTYVSLSSSYLGPDGAVVPFGHAGRATAATAVWMAVWWLSEALPIYATALLPLVVLPLLGARSIRETAAPYAHELIYLFLGGFLVALAMERSGLHRRIALVALRLAGERPVRMVGAFMAVTAFLSMWVSNTATAIMMLPVAVSVIDLVEAQATGQQREAGAVRNFALALLLGIAYSASIGGLATPIGTPPNLFLLSFTKESLGREVSFVRWMGVALPLVLVFLPATWLLLTRVLHPIPIPRIEGGARLVRESLARLGDPSRAERITLAVFLLVALLWITRPLLVSLEVAGVRPLAGLTDAGIAMLAAMLLFVAPVDWRAGRFVLDWDAARELPWGILVLFGGGLSLAAAIRANGVAEFLGAQVGAFAGLSALAIVLAVVTGVVFLTELTSNTATAATLIPILASLAPGLGMDPLLLAVPAALAASCAFMLPVAKPPNAIVFGSERVTIAEMSRAGFWLNWIGVALITGLTFAVVAPALGGG